jgi:HSP90 family molecular chaperone
METQNVTLAISKESLRRAKKMAIQQQTSLSRLLSNLIDEIAAQEESYYEVAKQRHLALLKKGFNLGTHGKATWTREELHERK